MKFKVHMVAFEDPIRVREVEPPLDQLEAATSTSDVLELIFKHGQNDFQPQQCCSVSVGDVAELEPLTPDSVGYLDLEGGIRGPEDWDPGLWLVSPCGFTKITREQFEAHKALPRLRRSMNAYNLSNEG
jgi:hypothetical protein